EAPEVAQPPQPSGPDDAELTRREEEARRQAELIRRQEEELAAKRREREEAEARQRAEEEARSAAAEKARREEEAQSNAKEGASAARAAEAEAAQAVAKAQAEARDKAATEAREKAAAESKARADEEAARARDLGERRRKAEAEAAAIRSMMSAPKKVLVAKVPEKPVAKAPEPAKPGVKGTLHKPPAQPGRPAAPGAATAPNGPGAGKEVKSAKLSSSWANDPAKKKEIKTRGDSSGGVGRNAWRGGPRGGRRDHRDRDDHQQAAPVEQRVIEVHVPETITVSELAHKMAIKASEVIKALMKMGQLVTINQSLDQDTAMIVVEEMGHKAVTAALDDPEAFTEEEVSGAAAEALPRAPVVTVMGHVDHGKTKLLDAIRHTDVVAREAGGITQHIGAYQVRAGADGRLVTFIDTPGHEAFTAMRARGAAVTDVAVLVVAADDGVMPQTVEAINHAKAAGVPIVVAVNKVDKPEANPAKVRQQLTEYDLVAEEYGGKTQFVDVSAKTEQGLDTLVETILLVADVELNLKANPDRRAQGSVIEAHLDKGRGPVATILVRRGTLHVGDAVAAGTAFGRVRAMFDENGKEVTAAVPAQPVVVIGLSAPPSAGDEVRAVTDERIARGISQTREARQRQAAIATSRAPRLEDLFARIREGQLQELPLIIKADVMGSVEAIDDALGRIEIPEVRLRVLHKAAGAITEDDVTLASVSGAIIIGFSVRPTPAARDLASREGVDIRLYSVIYQVVEDIEKALKGLLAPEYEERQLGTAEVRQTFRVPRVGVVAGSYVTSGEIARGARARLVRDGVVVYDGRIGSLRRFKEDARTVAAGYECGIGLDNFQDVKEGDQIEAYEMVEIPR
ncbi:MAG: translation initiation factor IF-2, partial [Actinomycetota bacterium]